ncbi:regulatory protein SipA [Almyronema epifaneia]|uniref:Regulatory protein SipA n=1 Tax=Almyronema epifaneia S1 TaxID=2991925 RepID=A0ABW6ID50_9CYAN
MNETPQPMADFAVGDRVRLTTPPPYLKTADTMPMLRPPDLVQLGEEGTIVDRRPGGYWGVKFERGTFLIDSQYIEAMPTHLDNS